MAFLEMIPEVLEGLSEAGQGASMISPLLNAWSNQTTQANSFLNSNYQQLQMFGQQRAMQNAAMLNAQQMQENQLSSAENINLATNANRLEIQNNAQEFYQTNQNSIFEHQTGMQQAGFENQARLQLNSFDQQNNLVQSQFTNNLKTGAVSSAFNLTGNLISSGINYLATSALLNQQASLQRENFDYTTSKAANAYTDAGLPSWLAYGGGSGMNAFPRQTQTLSGNNLYTSSLPGNQSSMIWTGSSSQMAFGSGDLPSVQ